jgi:RND family efflux transporter MFP subunit
MKRFNLKKFLPLLITAIGILIFIILQVTRPEPKQVDVKERIWQIQTITVQPQSLAPSLPLYGQVETPALVNAAAPSKSRVLSVAVREGDPISKGQLLLKLDPRDYQPKVKQAKARVSELRALINSEKLHHEANKKAYRYEQSILKLEQAAVKRAKMLKNKNLGSTAALELAQEELERQRLAYTDRKMTLDDHQARLQQLNARLAYAEAELEMSELELERSQIIAPFAGFVEKLLVAAGDQVKENQVLITFYPLDQLEVRAKIPATFRHELQRSIIRGQKLYATTILAGIPVTLELDRVAGAADARGIDALFTITEGNNLVRPGSTLSLSLKRPVQQHAIALPFSAIYDNNRIYKLAAGRLATITVKHLGDYIDQKNNVQALVSSPQIQAGDKIVITHLPNAVNGLRVVEKKLASTDLL